MITTTATQVRVTYDGDQHCTAVQQANGRTVAVDCPYTGGGAEFTPGNLVGAGLAGCILLSMGALARRAELDIAGTALDVDVQMIDRPEPRIGGIDVTVHVPRDFAPKDRQRLERAAAACPIKHSFGSETKIYTSFEFGAAEVVASH